MSLLLILSLVFLLSWNVAAAGDDDQQKAFVQCLSNSTSVASNISNIVYPSDNPSFSSILEFSIRNRRFDTPTTPKPLVIVTPRNVSHIQSAVLCAQSHNLQLRVRSGGHDYEGLSYLIQMSNITVDVANRTAWVQSGATVGQVYAQSTIQFAGVNGTTLDSLESRTPVKDVIYFKAKSDYVTKPIPDSAMDGLLKMMMQDGIEQPYVIFTPYGGKMAEIASNSIPFPHREGNLFKIQYLVYWKEDSEEVSNAHMKWIRDVYDYMGSYVSSNPRAAYINYRDLDIGENMNSSTGGNGTTAYQQAKVWGVKYFKGNFERLVKIKTAFDPTNFFSNEQSIPSLGAGKEGQTTSSNSSSSASAPSGDSDGGNNAGNETQSGDNNAGNGTQSGDVGQGDNNTNNNNNNGTQIGGVGQGDNGNSTTQTSASVVVRYGPRSYYYLVLLFLVLFI
ncbi:unnamed protein product [Linum tenue]|uniref:FAD-binding PCMH-type domain-containing protein n=1 Tax=Linum tenue TaxID=586396 RepID=A0AAV0N0J6_9ROSI|nr:unnamed protein product [Linum tenue]